MATGRIGVTPVLRTRWSDQPTVGTTSLSGLDDNSVSLVYDVGYEAVYRNGVLLSRGNDYTATDGTTVTLTDATLAGDIIEIFANELVPLADAIGKGQYNAKGALLSATAASTPGVLAVGANDTVLTADSSEATGLKWAAAAGGMTLISTTTLTGSSVTLSSIPQTYKNLQLVVRNFLPADNNRYIGLRINGDSNTRYFYTSANATGNTAFANAEVELSNGASNSTSESIQVCNLYDYTNTVTWKLFESVSAINDDVTSTNVSHTRNFMVFNQTGAITELNVLNLYSGNFTSGTVLLYGVK